MKGLWNVFLALFATAVAVICLLQRSQIRELRARAALLEQNVDRQRAELVEAKRPAGPGDNGGSGRASADGTLHRQKARGAAGPLGAPEAPAAGRLPGDGAAADEVDPAPADAEKAATGGGLGDLIARMMDDPAMKKMIREQQAGMLEITYGALFKEMNLSADETARFKELLLDETTGGVEKAGIFLKAGADPGEKADVIQQLSQQHDDAEEQLKAFLGEARYAQYKDYAGTLTERMQLSQFNQQLGSTQNSLTDQQTSQLLEIMKAENQATPGRAEWEGWTGKGDWGAMFTDEQVDRMLKQTEEANQRILQRAASVLTPEQLQSFGSFQSVQLQMQRMGMTMAAKMFSSPDSESAKPPTTNP